MDKVRFITYKKKRILYIDLSQCTPEEGLDIIKNAKGLIAQQPKNSLLTLTNVEKGRYNTKLVEGLKKFTKHNKPYVKKGAVIGLAGIQKVIYHAVMKFSKRNMPVFDTIEEAEDWLIKD